jgi:hypothetical protein
LGWGGSPKPLNSFAPVCVLNCQRFKAKERMN